MYLYAMKVDAALIERLGNLARLQFDEEEKKEIMSDLSNIIGFVDTLKSLDVTGEEPLIHMNARTNVLRSDTVQMEITHEEALLNAPEADSDYFKVPKVLKKK
jgi:aspartyl-tRNA(Asn)/glutamyl-tRNA(Gln) amidotransferase subunit C